MRYLGLREIKVVKAVVAAQKMPEVVVFADVSCKVRKVVFGVVVHQVVLVCHAPPHVRKSGQPSQKKLQIRNAVLL